jgi:hypothetical protein
MKNRIPTQRDYFANSSTLIDAQPIPIPPLFILSNRVYKFINLSIMN